MEAGQMSREEDLDEFDKILYQVSMVKMNSGTSDNDILHMTKIKEIYLKRAARKEFATKNFNAYVQFGVIIN